MCDPATLALTIGSKIAQQHFQNKAAQDVVDARNAAQQRFFRDVDAQRQKAAGQFQNSLQQVSKPAEQANIEQAIQERAALNQPSFDTRTLLPGGGDTSNAVKTAIITAQNRGDAEIDEAGQRAAILGAFGDADLRRNIGLLQNANRINTAGNFARGSNTILEAGLADAASAGNRNLSIADAIGGIGTLGSAAAANGAFSAGGFTLPGTGQAPSIIKDLNTGALTPIPGVKPTRINFFNPNSISGL